MPDPRKRAFELDLPGEEAASALARLTSEAPEGHLLLGEDRIPLEDWTRLRVSCQRLGDRCRLKVRLTDAGPESVSTDETTSSAPRKAPTASGTLRYKELKKRMKKAFKFLQSTLAAGQVPPPEPLAAFLADARRMTTYPGKGDAFYPAFNAAVDRLEQAAAGGELAAVSRCVAELARMKKECHDRYA